MSSPARAVYPRRPSYCRYGVGRRLRPAGRGRAPSATSVSMSPGARAVAALAVPMQHSRPADRSLSARPCPLPRPTRLNAKRHRFCPCYQIGDTLPSRLILRTPRGPPTPFPALIAGRLSAANSEGEPYSDVKLCLTACYWIESSLTEVGAVDSMLRTVAGPYSSNADKFEANSLERIQKSPGHRKTNWRRS
jgi:hypothetical protein